MIPAMTSVSYLFPEPESLQLLFIGVTEKHELLDLVGQTSLLSCWLLHLFPQIASIILSETKTRVRWNYFSGSVCETEEWQHTIRLTSDSLSVLVSMLAVFFFSSRASVSSAIFLPNICFSSEWTSPCSRASFSPRQTISVSYTMSKKKGIGIAASSTRPENDG